MKKLTLLLIAASLALNVALLGVLLAGYGAAPAPAATPVAKPKAPIAAKSAIDAKTWTDLQTADLPAMVQRLRERGFPPEIVRAILAAQLRESHAAREKAIDPDADNRPFWKNYPIDPKVQAARMQLYREQQKTLRALLGADADPRENMNALYQGRRFDSVPAEKLPDVQRVLREFEDARQDIYSSNVGSFSNETQKRLAALEKDQQAALAAVLTPQELEEWNVRNSDTSRSLRGQLTAFNPTEQEFRAIYRLQADFDERFGRMYSMPSAEEQQRRGEAQRQMNEQIKGMLGPVRGADYERANDFSYRQTSQLVARLELPPETTNQVYAIQKDIQQRMSDAFRSGTAAADREALLAKLAAETQTRVSAVLGPRGYEAYQQYGGSWMQSLRRRPPSPAGAPTTPGR